MELIKSIVIPDPPTKFVTKKRTPKLNKSTGKLITENVYYLTANIFYSTEHYFTRAKIMNYCKEFLIIYLKKLPKLEKARIELIYQRTNTNFDLDNKAYFWMKILLDLLKTPTNKQILKANKYHKEIITADVLKDDTVKYVDSLVMKYEPGPHQMIINIYGKKENEQINLFN